MLGTGNSLRLRWWTAVSYPNPGHRHQLQIVTTQCLLRHSRTKQVTVSWLVQLGLAQLCFLLRPTVQVVAIERCLFGVRRLRLLQVNARLH